MATDATDPPLAEFWDVDNQTYHDDDTHMAHGRLLKFRRNSYEFFRRHILQDMPWEPPSRAMELGSALHIAVCEPDLLLQKVMLYPAHAGPGSKHGKALRASAPRSVILITAEEAERLHNMGQAIRSVPWIQERLEPRPERVYEHAVRFRYPTTHETTPCKVKFDWLDRAVGETIDFKSANEATRPAFKAQARKMGYPTQAAYYTVARNLYLGIPACWHQGRTGYFWVVVQNRPPYAVQIFELGMRTYAAAEAVNRHELARYSLLRDLAEEQGDAAWWSAGGGKPQLLEWQPSELRAL